MGGAIFSHICDHDEYIYIYIFFFLIYVYYIHADIPTYIYIYISTYIYIHTQTRTHESHTRRGSSVGVHAAAGILGKRGINSILGIEMNSQDQAFTVRSLTTSWCPQQL